MSASKSNTPAPRRATGQGLQVVQLAANSNEHKLALPPAAKHSNPPAEAARMTRSRFDHRHRCFASAESRTSKAGKAGSVIGDVKSQRRGATSSLVENFWSFPKPGQAELLRRRAMVML